MTDAWAIAFVVSLVCLVGSLVCLAVLKNMMGEKDEKGR